MEDIVKTLNWFMGDVVQAKISEDGYELLLTKGSNTLALTIPDVRGAWNEPDAQYYKGNLYIGGKDGIHKVAV